MLLWLNDLISYDAITLDDSQWSVSDIFFDSIAWDIRYLVIDTGGWLPRHRVLIAPKFVRAINSEKNSLLISLTKEQVKASPQPDSDMPVSRQRELLQLQNEGFDPFWVASSVDLAAPLSVGIQSALTSAELSAEAAEEIERTSDANLRSANEVLNYVIEASDGSLGNVKDFSLDETSWQLPYIVADTGEWLSGRRVPIPCKLVQSIEWEKQQVLVDADKTVIKNSPQLSDEGTIDERLRKAIEAYYG